MIRKRPYSNYYKKRQYFLGGVLGTIGGMVGGPVGSVVGSTIGNIGMNILNKDTDWLGRPKQKPMLPRFQGNTASSYGNFAMGGYAPLGPDSVKYIGPKHKDGGILIDEDGMPTDNEQEAIAEVEGGETRDDNYIFSDELKYPGTDLTFAEVHETMVETGASEQDIEELKAIQEEVRESTGIAAKEREGMQMRNGSEIPKKDPPITQEFYTAPSERRPYNWAAQQQRIAEEELRKKEIEERRARIQDSLDVRDTQSDSYIPLTGEGSNLTERMARETQALGDKLRVSEEPNFFDDYINPLAFLGELTSGVGSVPKNVREGNYGAAAFGIGAPLATGALAGIGARSLGQFANNLANPLAGARSSVKNLFDPKPNNKVIKPEYQNDNSNGFTSEINWGKWNKETPENKALMDEYLAIEKQAKADGTWMKNPDGSKTLMPDGSEISPELWVQSQSNNWVKAYGKKGIDAIRDSYRGVRPEKSNPDLSKGYTGGDRGIFTADIDLANGYIGGGIWPSLPVRWIAPILRPGDEGTGGLYHLLYPKGKNIDIDTMNSHWTDVNLSGPATPETDLKSLSELRSMVNGLKRNERFSTDDIAKWLHNQDLKNITLRNISDGGMGDVTIINNKLGQYAKSAVGNNGMFDMTDPNIYKSLLPVFGAAGASQIREQKYGGKLNKYQDGGYTSALRDAGIPLISLPKYIMALNKANKKGYTMQSGGYIQNNLINQKM